MAVARFNWKHWIPSNLHAHTNVVALIRATFGALSFGGDAKVSVGLRVDSAVMAQAVAKAIGGSTGMPRWAVQKVILPNTQSINGL